jgi:carboxymethylenebutenolidase
MRIPSLLFGLILFAAPAGAQDFARERLEKSPRHHEWQKVTYDKRDVHCFVVYPEKKENALAVIVIHENRGLTDWVRSFADQLAERGYIAIAPDLLSGFGDTLTRTSDFASEDDARNAIYKLDPDQVTRDLAAVQKHAGAMKAANGKTALAGFCWGGMQTFRYATNSTGLSAALVFYGPSPTDSTAYARVATPVYGFYAGDDQRVNATIDDARARMKESKKKYDVQIYDGAGHGFMRMGDAPDASEPNRKARDASWERLTKVLSEIK